jgi:hypothetical protein
LVTGGLQFLCPGRFYLWGGWPVPSFDASVIADANWHFKQNVLLKINDLRFLLLCHHANHPGKRITPRITLAASMGYPEQG